MKTKNLLQKAEKILEPELTKKSKKMIDPNEVERNLEQQNQVLKKMISRLRKPDSST